MVPPSVPGSPPVVVSALVSAKLVEPADSIAGSAEMSVGMPLGEKPVEFPAPSAWAAGTDTGLRIAAFGSSSTSTSVASPQVRPVSACVRAADRPGGVLRDHAESQRQHLEKHHHPRGDRQRRGVQQPPSLVGRQGFSPRREKWK